jgi:hypothetical protein
VWDAVDATRRKTRRIGADGEAVWSRRPDAGVKSVKTPAHHASDVAFRVSPMKVARKPGHLGERGGNR